MKINVDKINDKEVVKAVKETIKELQKEHEANIKYRPYAQDICYAMKAKGSYILSLGEMKELLSVNKIEIKQPKDPNAVPKELVKAK